MTQAHAHRSFSEAGQDRTANLLRLFQCRYSLYRPLPPYLLKAGTGLRYILYMPLFRTFSRHILSLLPSKWCTHTLTTPTFPASSLVALAYLPRCTKVRSWDPDISHKPSLTASPA